MTHPAVAQAILGVRSLAAGYHGRPVLRGVSMDARRGEMVGVVGPNGAGKSTLLKTITGALSALEGTVTIAGRDRHQYRLNELARIVAYVPQAEPTLFEFTVRDVVMMGRHPHAGASTALADFEIADRAMTATDIVHLGERPITALSGGEHRRVILARAIAQSPALMLLDEPTAHLDVTHQTDILSLLARMTRTDGLCAIAALHDLNAAAEYCDRLVLIASGRVLADGAPDDVLRSAELRDAYGTDFHVMPNPISTRPMVLPTDARPWGSSETGPHIHVICGGGTGAHCLVELARIGCRLTVGVLNRHDTDDAAAQALGLEVVHEEPFSPISQEAMQKALEVGRDAKSVLVCAIPIGHGNIRNLELAKSLGASGTPIILVDDPPIADRDFTDGAATGLWRELASRPGATVLTQEDVTATVRRLIGGPHRGQGTD